MAGSLIQELKRRNVFRVALVYVVVSWLLMQIGDVMFPALRLPDWTTTLLVAFLILGFPLAVIFAWAFELTPDGVVRTSEVPQEQSITSDTGRKINYTIIGVLALAVVFLLVKDTLLPRADVPQTIELNDRSIAVLPFKNQSASSENAEFFAGGLHDELLTVLSRIGGLRVISRTSVERLDPNLTIPEIGELLGVATVLEGQVQRAGDRLRINVQLIDTAAEGHLWANTYDRLLTAENVFEVQSDIARTITDALHAEISPAEEALLGAVPTANTEALEKYLLGEQLWKRQSFGALDEAVRYLTQATTLDPQYAEAWVALAAAYTSAHQTGAMSTVEYVRAAEPAVRKAMDINPRLAAAHTQQASVQLALGDMEGAESSFRQALELDPNDSATVAEYAFFLRESFRAEEAIPLLKAALVNDPLSTELLFQLGKAEMHSGRPERYVEISARIREIDPSIVNGYTGAMQAYLWMGRTDLALPWYIHSLDFDPLDYENWAHFGLSLNGIGLGDLADRYMKRAEELGASEPGVIKCRVQILLNRGEFADAVRLSRKALAADLDDRWGSDHVFLRTARDAALDAGRIDDVLGLYRERVPEVFKETPEVDLSTARYAVDLVPLLQFAGEDTAAERIIAATLDAYERLNPQRIRGYDLAIVDIEALALAGEKDLALTRLTEAAANGWRLNWEYFVRGRNLALLRDEPEYAAVVARLEAASLEQGARWMASPHLGEFDLRDTSAK
jgi:TolB-like protein/Flp pilus assembly protein TadD